MDENLTTTPVFSKPIMPQTWRSASKLRSFYGVEGIVVKPEARGHPKFGNLTARERSHAKLREFYGISEKHLHRSLARPKTPPPRRRSWYSNDDIQVLVIQRNNPHRRQSAFAHDTDHLHVSSQKKKRSSMSSVPRRHVRSLSTPQIPLLQGAATSNKPVGTHSRIRHTMSMVRLLKSEDEKGAKQGSVSSEKEQKRRLDILRKGCYMTKYSSQ